MAGVAAASHGALALAARSAAAKLSSSLPCSTRGYPNGTLRERRASAHEIYTDENDKLSIFPKGLLINLKMNRGAKHHASTKSELLSNEKCLLFPD